MVDDYVKELLCKDTNDYPVEKLEYIMRFVLEEERPQDIHNGVAEEKRQ